MASCRLTPLYLTTRAYGTPGWYRCVQDSPQKSLSQGQRGSRFKKPSVHLPHGLCGIWNPHLPPVSLVSFRGATQVLAAVHILFFFFLSEKARHSAWVLILSRGEQPDGKRWGRNTLEAGPKDPLSHKPVVLTWAYCHNSSPRQLARALSHRVTVLLPPSVALRNMQCVFTGAREPTEQPLSEAQGDLLG